jgi:hypothetical protein
MSQMGTFSTTLLFPTSIETVSSLSYGQFLMTLAHNIW